MDNNKIQNRYRFLRMVKCKRSSSGVNWVKVFLLLWFYEFSISTWTNKKKGHRWSSCTRCVMITSGQLFLSFFQDSPAPVLWCARLGWEPDFVTIQMCKNVCSCEYIAPNDEFQIWNCNDDDDGYILSYISFINFLMIADCFMLLTLLNC